MLPFSPVSLFFFLNADDVIDMDDQKLECAIETALCDDGVLPPERPLLMTSDVMSLAALHAEDRDVRSAIADSQAISNPPTQTGRLF